MNRRGFLYRNSCRRQYRRRRLSRSPRLRRTVRLVEPTARRESTGCRLPTCGQRGDEHLWTSDRWRVCRRTELYVPHRFWLVAGDMEQVDVDVDDSMHLMITAWDVETDTVLPVNVGLELPSTTATRSTDGSLPWPMLSQRMGFHYGDNIRRQKRENAGSNPGRPARDRAKPGRSKIDSRARQRSKSTSSSSDRTFTTSSTKKSMTTVAAVVMHYH